MKAILISIKPRFVAKILNGEKTIEIRKSCPQVFKNLKPYEGCSIDVYIYCSKSNYLGFISKRYVGKVVAKFTLNRCQEWHNYSWQEITEKGCITDEELRAYGKDRKSLYIWHISNLVIFDKPKELSEFKHYTNVVIKSNNPYTGEPHYSNNKVLRPLTKAPQSWQFIEIGE